MEKEYVCYFVLQQQARGEDLCEYDIINVAVTSWHEAVRGNGHSYCGQWHPPIAADDVGGLETLRELARWMREVAERGQRCPCGCGREF